LKQSILIAKQTDKEHIYYFMAMTQDERYNTSCVYM